MRKLGLVCVLLAGCHGGGGGGGDSGMGGGDGAAGSDANVPGVDGSAPGTDAGPAAACPAGDVGAALGRDRLLIGGAMEDADFATAPFDLRYRYLAGAVPAGGPCTSCATGCMVNGSDCSNAVGCEWWGCWQWDQEPPGRYVANNITADEAAGAVPMFTYYVWLAASGYSEGVDEVLSASDGTELTAYIADWRFFMQTIAASTSGPVIVHVEPDLWGYGEQYDADPEAIPAAVAAAGAAECAGQPDTFGGFARCLLAIARAEAPSVLIGFHASAWGAGEDAYINTDPGWDALAHADETSAWLTALGADGADLIVVEMSDRDAGFNTRWWDDTDTTLPDFAQAIAWVERLGAGLGLAPLWWQVPYGHVGLENMCDMSVMPPYGRWEDNRVAYVFDHPERFAAAGSLGVAFGAGEGCQTTPTTDDGYFVGRAAGYYALGAGRPCLCGTCP